MPNSDPHPFIIKGGDLYLVVGRDKTQFRIHSHFLVRESEWWKNELIGPESSAGAPLRKGTSPTNAYHLGDELPEDFCLLLGVFYHNKYGDYSHVTTAQWMVILRLAQKWKFKEVQGLAIRYLEKQDMNIAERIVFYQKNRVPNKYLLPHFVTLVSRPEGLELEECRILGHKNFWLLHHARDELWRSPKSAGGLHGLDIVEATDIVKGVYAKAIKDMMDPTSVTKDSSECNAEDVEDEDEREKSDTGSWEDMDEDEDEQWEALTIPGSFSLS